MKRLERKTQAVEASDHTFTPQLNPRKTLQQSPPHPRFSSQGGVPVEMNQQYQQSSPHAPVHGQPLRQSPYRGQQPHAPPQFQSGSASLDQIASDSLDHFYASEGARLQGGVFAVEGSSLTPGKENHHGHNGHGSGQRRAGTNPLSPSGDALGQELRRHPQGDGSSSPFLSKFGQELYQESFGDNQGKPIPKLSGDANSICPAVVRAIFFFLLPHPPLLFLLSFFLGVQ